MATSNFCGSPSQDNFPVRRAFGVPIDSWLWKWQNPNNWPDWQAATCWPTRGAVGRTIG